MEFRTIIKLSENKRNINHDDKIVMLGSCFSDNIGTRLRDAMMQVDINPFGTIYNPASINQSVLRIIHNQLVTDDEMFHANGVWNNFSFHSRYSSADKITAIDKMDKRISFSHEHLRESNMLIITLGTAIVYESKAIGRVVSNCHKLPSQEFVRRMLSISEVEESLRSIIENAHLFNPKIKIIFTVSPIRHVADGLEQNQLSKSTLRVAIGNMIKEYPAIVEYFPAYEIMMDDLRDYRFYAADMVHPSDVAIDYIWNTFQGAYFDDRTAQAVQRCERVTKRLTHRIMTDNEEVAERFKKETYEVVTNLVGEYPYLENLSQVKNVLSKKL